MADTTAEVCAASLASSVGPLGAGSGGSGGSGGRPADNKKGDGGEAAPGCEAADAGAAAGGGGVEGEAPPPPAAGRRGARRYALAQTVGTSLVMQGVVFNMSILAGPVADAHPSWPGQAVPYSLSVCAAVVCVFALTLSSRFRSGGPQGTRFFLCMGIIMFSVGVALAGVALRAGQAWLFIAGLGVGNAASLGVVYGALVTHGVAHFGPGPAGSIVGGCTGLSAFAWAPLLDAMLRRWSVEEALYIIAAGMLVLIPLQGGVSLRKGQVAGAAFARAPTLTKAAVLGSRQYIGLALCVVGGLLPAWGQISIYAETLRDVGGVSQSQAAHLTAVVNAAYCVGRFAGGFLCAACGPRRTYAATLLVEAAAFAAMAATARRTLPGFVACQCVAAVCYGAVKVGVPSLIIVTFGGHNMQVVFSAFSLIFSAASTAGPIVAAALSGTRSFAGGSGPEVRYDNLFLVSAAFAVLGAVGCAGLMAPHAEAAAGKALLDGDEAGDSDSDGSDGDDAAPPADGAAA